MPRHILIGLTQRVTLNNETSEKRDSLAQDWGRLMAGLDILWVALPNRPAEAPALAGRLNLTGLLLTGGDDWGVFPERDETELSLLDWAQGTGRRIVGVCRGFQVIQIWRGGRLTPVDQARHVRARHEVRFIDGRSAMRNSYHAWGILEAAPGFAPLAVCPEDGSIEAAAGDEILGLMWHPERENEPSPDDAMLLRRYLAE
jgi:putative glutamine amidotransferase